MAGSGGAVGVLLGGVPTEYLGWEWVLFVNVPIAFAAAVAATPVLPESSEEGPRHYDVAGAVSITAGISLLVYALVDAVNEGWGSTRTLGLIAIALALIAVFIVIERRARFPLIDFAIFRRRTLTGANVVAVLVAMSLFSMFFFVSLYMQQVLGYDALKAGFAYLPLALGIIVAAGIASQLVTRVGFKPIMIAGFLFVSAGLLWFAQVSVAGGYVSDVLFPSLLAAVGLAILATIANSRTQDEMAAVRGNPRELPAALTEGFQAAFYVGAGFGILGAVLTAVLISSRTSREHAEAARRGEVDVVPVAA